jgi:hypothetical protein
MKAQDSGPRGLMTPEPQRPDDWLLVASWAGPDLIYVLSVI